MKWSPWIDAHPQYAALLSGIGNDLRWKSDGESFAFYAVDRFGRPFWESPEAVLTKLPLYEARVVHRTVDGRKPRVYFAFIYRKNGIPYRVITRVTTKRGYLNGTLTLSIVGRNAQYAPIVRKSRRRVRSQYLKTRVRKPVVPKSSTLRPSPETINRPYMRINGQVGSTGVENFVTMTPTSRLYYQRTWTGVRTPGYGSVPKRQLPNNPHTVVIKDVSLDSFAKWSKNMTSKQIDWSFEAYSNVFAPPTALAEHLPYARNKAIRKLLDRANLGVQANLAQDFAQVGQTLNLLSDSIQRIRTSVLALKSGNIPKAITTLTANQRPVRVRGKRYQPYASQGVASNWLALQYAWKPLLQNIKGTLQSLADSISVGGFVNVATASGTADSQVSSKLPLTYLSPASVSAEQLQSTLTRCKLKLYYQVDDHLKQFMAQTGFTNPVNLAWEILPFSFVADWFIPIGPFLETLSAWDGLKFRGGSQVLFTRRTTVITLDYAGFPGGNPLGLFRNDRGRYVRTEVLLNRSALSAFPSSTIPSFTGTGLTSIPHIQNGLALLTNLFK